MGEYCEMGEAPLNAPVGVGGFKGLGNSLASAALTLVLSGDG